MDVRQNKRLMLVTGASGFLGRHLMAASEAGRWETLAPSSGSMDIRSRARVLDEITTWKPQVVVHLAYRRDDRQIIVDGTRNVAEAAAAAGARLIHLSTDVVFAGRERPYTEADATDARIDYGRWKAEAEVVLWQAHPGALAIRTSLLYGTETQLGHAITDVTESLAGHSSTKFFTDEYRCPRTSPTWRRRSSRSPIDPMCTACCTWPARRRSAAPSWRKRLRRGWATTRHGCQRPRCARAACSARHAWCSTRRWRPVSACAAVHWPKRSLADVTVVDYLHAHG